MMYTTLGLGDARQITGTVGGTIAAAGGIVAAVPGLQLPGAIIAGVGILTSLIGSLFKPDITKIEASNIVDQIEAQVLKPMRASWQSLSADQKTPEMQAQYLQIFDQAWNGVMQGCGNPQLGTAGQNCISDRQEGACHYTVAGQTPGNPPDCGNWFVWYRDPIANDPAVGSASVSGIASDLTSSIGSAVGGSLLPIVLIAALALAVTD